MRLRFSELTEHNILKQIIALFIVSTATVHARPADTDELQCLADNIYFEARNQNETGQIAVAVVTLNRVKSKDYPDTICKVVWQQSMSQYGKKVAQFSWTLDGKSDKPAEVNVYADIYKLAEIIIAEDAHGELNFFNSDKVLNYHSTAVKPKWDYSKLKPVATIGKHIFYRTL